MKKSKIILASIAFSIFLIVWYSFITKNLFYEWTLFFGPYLKNGYSGAATFIILSVLSAMISPFSSAPLVPIAIVIWGPLPTSVMLLAGWVIGGVLSYAIGKKFGHGIASNFISGEKIDKWSRQIESKLSFFVILVFRMMTPSETGYIFGILKYPFWKYALITLLSEAPVAFALSYAGNAIISREREIFFLLALAPLFLVFVLYMIYRREFSRKP